MWKYLVIGLLLLQGSNSQPAQQKAQSQKQSPAPSVSPATLNQSQVEAGDKTNGASNSQQPKQDDETKAFQRTQIRQYWVLVGTSVITAILLIAYTVFAGLQWWQIRNQATHASEQVGKMQAQLDAINKQEAHLAAQAEAAKTQSEVMARQEALFQKQTTIMDKSLVYGTRAYVGIEKLAADYRARKIHLYIKNFGRVPANSIQVMLELRVQILRTLLPLTQPPTGWGAAGYDPDCWGTTVPFLHAYGKRTKLFPGQTLDVITFIEPYHLSRSEIMIVEQGEGVRIRIRGEVRYSDGFHKDKVTHYDFRYLGGEWVPQQLDDPVGLYSDQYKPDTDYEPS